MSVATTLNVVVHYVAAVKPYTDHDAPEPETVGQLKAKVLDFFHLTEGGSPDGTVTTYTLYVGKEALTDLSRTIGSLAGGKKELQLKLNQQIVQGA
jgi:hypothetical protein